MFNESFQPEKSIDSQEQLIAGHVFNPWPIRLIDNIKFVVLVAHLKGETAKDMNIKK